MAGTDEELEFSAKLALVPEERELIEQHRSHLVELNDLDRPYVTEQIIRQGTMTGTRDEVRASLDAFRATGASMFLYSPFGPDIPHELETFASAAGL